MKLTAVINKSHIRLKKRTDKGVYIVVVPDHREVAAGTLMLIISALE